MHPLAEILGRLGVRAPEVRRRLFELERPVPLGEADAALDNGDIERLVDAGLVRVSDGWLVPRVRIDPVESLLVASDLRHHRLRRDFVLGPGPAGFLLARHVQQPRRGPLLDLGTGSGLQALVLGGPSSDAVGIDINPRAVDFARFNAALNERPRFRAELGDFLGPDPDRRHDGHYGTVVANPPFVLSPASEVTYRDRTLPGDEVGARTVERVARALARGGRGYVLCNWIDRRGDPDGPAHAWARAAGAAATVHRLVTRDADAYAETWTRDDAAGEPAAAAARWAASLRAEGIDQVHLGVIELARRRGSWPFARKLAPSSAG